MEALQKLITPIIKKMIKDRQFQTNLKTAGIGFDEDFYSDDLEDAIMNILKVEDRDMCGACDALYNGVSDGREPEELAAELITEYACQPS